MDRATGRPAEPITVVMTCFKEGELLLRAVESVDAQTDADVDLVVVNDGSPDPVTREVCARLADRPRTTVRVRPQNGGLSAARNDGFGLVSGGVCVLLDGDDTLPPTAIAAVRRGFASRPDVDFLFGDYRRRDVEAGTSTVVRCADLCGDGPLLSPRALARGPWKLLGASPCRRSAWQRVGGFSSRFPGMQDLDFWVRVLLDGGTGLYVPEVIYEWHRSERGMNATTTSHERVTAIAEHLPFFDRFGDPRAIRRRLPRQLWMDGDVGEARELARKLLGERRFALAPERLLCHLPLPVSAATHRLARYAYRLASRVSSTGPRGPQRKSESPSPTSLPGPAPCKRA